MRIAFVGNQGNNAYRLCKWLRSDGSDHSLVLLGESPMRSLPELVDRDAAPPRPGWIQSLDTTPHQGRVGWRELFSRATDPAIAAIESSHDVAVTSGFHGLFAAPSIRRIPVVHLSLGSEVTELPLRWRRPGYSRGQRIESLMALRALRHVGAVVTSYSRTVSTLGRLGHRDKTRLWGFPEDLATNRSRVDTDELEQLSRRYADLDALFVWMSRLNFLDTHSGDYKAPERFLAAFERLVLRDRRNVRALVGDHGRDAKAFREQVAERGLEPYIDFVPHMPYWQLLTHLAIPNAVVFDLLDLEKGTLGGLVREALSLGAAVVMAIDRDSMDTFYGPGCPILDAPGAQPCYEAMVQLLDMSPSEREDYRKRCNAWAQEFLDWPGPAARFGQIVRETLYKDRIQEKLASFARRDPEADGRLAEPAKTDGTSADPAKAEPGAR